MWGSILSIMLIVLAGCSAFSIGDANKLQKGLNKAQVLALVSKGPDITFEISLPGESGQPLEVMSFDLKNSGTIADYFVVFENDKLMYWGYPYEFNRYPDVRVNEIGRIAVEESKKY